ncbi:MAG TPA: hypothetical protein VIV40_15415 [Kofleriaceae bacterium]
MALGCKGETVVKDNPDTLRDLDVCKKTLEESKKLAQALQDENARLMRGSGGSEILVTIEGNMMTVRPAKPGEVRPVDDKVIAAASKQFEDLVHKSRGAIQKCYEQVLKKDTNLQSRTVTLTVSASFSNVGAYQSSSFHATQDLGDTFDSCMKTIAQKWQLPQNSQAMTFKAQVSLTPS